LNSRVIKAFLFVGIPAAILGVGVLWGGLEVRSFLMGDKVFQVQDVEVVTKGNANKEMVLKRAAIAPGSNIFSLDLEAVRGRVEAEPWVKNATVVRALPNRVQIYYEPQVPVALLGAEALYYLNREGVPFYKVQKGDSLNYPLLQLEGSSRSQKNLVDKLKTALDLLESLKKSVYFSAQDLGEITVRPESEWGGASFILTMKFTPPSTAKIRVKKSPVPPSLFSASFSATDLPGQIRRWDAVMRHILQEGRNPRLIRLELGKKVVVKLDR